MPTIAPAAIGDLYEIQYFNFEIGEVRADIQEDGFAYFANADGKVGYYPVPLHWKSTTLRNLDNPGGVPDYPATVTLTAADVNGFVENVTDGLRSVLLGSMRIDIMMPQVRFAYQNADCLHGIGTRMLRDGHSDNSISNWRSTLNSDLISYDRDALCDPYFVKALPLVNRDVDTFEYDSRIDTRFLELQKRYYPNDIEPETQLFNWGDTRVPVVPASKLQDINVPDIQNPPPFPGTLAFLAAHALGDDYIRWEEDQAPVATYARTSFEKLVTSE